MSESACWRIVVDGLNYELLGPLAVDGRLPHLGSWLHEAALGVVRAPGSLASSSCWQTLVSGSTPWEHGVFDDGRLDVQRRAVASCVAEQRADSSAVVLPGAAAAWAEVDSLTALRKQVARAVDEVERQTTAAEAALRGGPRQAFIRFGQVAALVECGWHWINAGPAWGGRPDWTSQIDRLWLALDGAIERLAQQAARHGAVCVVLSCHGSGPFYERVHLNEWLLRQGWLQRRHWTGRWAYRFQRLAWKFRRHRGQANRLRPWQALLPVDWQRSRVVHLHGRQTACLYVNSRERFGCGPVVGAAARQRCLDELIDALRQWRHPVSQQPLFPQVMDVAQRAGVDPAEQGWPDLLAIAAPGFAARPRIEQVGALFSCDLHQRAIGCGEGLIMARGAAELPFGQAWEIDLHDVARWPHRPDVCQATSSGWSVNSALRPDHRVA